MPQFLQRFFDLAHLIRLCHFAVPLQIYARFSLPWCFENMMAATYPGFTELLAADIQEVLEKYIMLAIHAVQIHEENDSRCAIIMQ